MKLVCVIHCGIRNEGREERELGRALLSLSGRPNGEGPFLPSSLPPNGHRRLKLGERHQKCNRGDVGERERDGVAAGRDCKISQKVVCPQKSNIPLRCIRRHTSRHVPTSAPSPYLHMTHPLFYTFFFAATSPFFAQSTIVSK